MWLLIFLSLTSIFVLSSLSYLFSQYMKDASFADVIWGMYFVVIAVNLVLQTRHLSQVQRLDAILVGIWGVRLTWHIMKRKVGKPEDWRYAAWRKQWGDTFAWRSLVQNFWFQGALAVTISLSTIVAAHASPSEGKLHAWQFIGVAIWIIGFLFETIGDWQLTKFLKKRRDKDAIMQSGLWRFTRHPNYFGEVTQWWGLFILVVALPYGWFALISPLTITFLILFVSGPTLLERKYKKNKAFQAYAKRTSVLFPLPPKT